MSRKMKIWLLIALFFPVAVWGVVVAGKAHVYYTGDTIVLPVRGYDPRDLLSGHYIQYEIDYDHTGCDVRNRDAYLHLGGYYEGEVRNYPPDSYEVLYIKGRCQGNRFIAGIERFYVPEEAAPRLDMILRGNHLPASIEVSVSRDGRAQVKSFMLDNRPWQEVLKDRESE